MTALNLPPLFLENMENQLGEEYTAFLESYQQPKATGLRVQTHKISVSALTHKLPGIGPSVPWTTDGYYYDESTVRPAKHPYYYAGLYYIQEPSAMLPAELLSAAPGQRVLDLCAAPGGKSIQIGAQLGRDGLLIVNDIHPQRARVLLKNIERYGIVNAVVLNASPEELVRSFSGFFDKVLIDAPCSGEGMFRKEPDMAKGWSPEEVLKYAHWQEEILRVAPRLLRGGGHLVYSTCTFSVEEDEEQVRKFINQHPNFRAVNEIRLWPHKVRGEGHFAAKMHEVSANGPLGETGEIGKLAHVDQPTVIQLPASVLEAVSEFSKMMWGDEEEWKNWLPINGTLIERSGHILWEHRSLPGLRGLKVLRSGWLLGTMERKGFRPSTAFALGLTNEAVSNARLVCHLSSDDDEELYTAIRYLRGETIGLEGRTWTKGWHLVCIDGYPLGWAKGAASWLKNEYPPGWRWTDGQEV